MKGGSGIGDLPRVPLAIVLFGLFAPIVGRIRCPSCTSRMVTLSMLVGPEAVPAKQRNELVSLAVKWNWNAPVRDRDDADSKPFCPAESKAPHHTGFAPVTRPVTA